MQESNIVVGLDIGTSKVACIVAERGGDGNLAVIGLGTHPSYGLKKGVVVDIQSTIQAIRLAVEEAELMADVHINQVCVGVAGSHIWSCNSQGVVAIENSQVSDDDVKRVIDAAHAWQMPDNKKIIHVIPQHYKLDSLEGVRNPVGMHGTRLEAQVHMITGDNFAIQNIVSCCHKCDLDVSHLVLEQIASSESVLSEDEKDIGVLMVDIGGGTTDLAVYKQGYLCHTSVIPIGGDHLTNDLAAGLKISTKEADRLKVKYGCCVTAMISNDDVVEVRYVGDREPSKVPRQVLAQFLEPRMIELFNLIREELMNFRFMEHLSAGVVLTGGSSLLEGSQQLAEEAFEFPVRIGRPKGLGGLLDVVNSPIYATGVGLVKYSRKFNKDDNIKSKRVGMKSLFQKVLTWFGV